MLSLNFPYLEDSLHRSIYSFDPASPTYSAPSPFSSGSSASYPNRSPVSDFTDSNHISMEDYSAPVYSQVQPPQDFDLDVMNWSKSQSEQYSHTPNQVERLKNLAVYIPPSSPSSYHQQRQQSPAIIHSPIPIPVPSNAHPHSPSIQNHSPHSFQSTTHRPQHQLQDQYFHAQVDKWRTSPTSSHHTQYPPAYHHSQSHSGAMPVQEQGFSSSSPSLHESLPQRRSMSDYSPHPMRIKQEDLDMYSSLGPYGGHRHRHIFDLSASPPKASISVPIQSHSPHMHPSPQLSASYYSQSQPQAQADQLHHPHNHTRHTHQNPHQQPTPTFAIHPADLAPSPVHAHAHAHAHGEYDASAGDLVYPVTTTVTPADAAGFDHTVFGPASEAGYLEGACDPQFVTGGANGVPEKSEMEMEMELERPGSEQPHRNDLDDRDGWEPVYEVEYGVGDVVSGNGNGGVGVGAAGGGEQQDERLMADDDADADADADGEDDVEVSYPSASTVAPVPIPAPHRPRRGANPAEAVREYDYDDAEEDDAESEDYDDDVRDPEFVLRRTRRRQATTIGASSSSAGAGALYPHAEGRSLRSTRYNPYPTTPYSTSPTEEYTSRSYSHSSHMQEYSPGSQAHRPRRAYSHNSVSPSVSEPYSPSSSGMNLSRRRVRPSTTLPIPVPVPNLTKKSRGRRVPTMDDFHGDEEAAPAPAPAAAKGRKKNPAAVAKGMRTYTCDVDGCGKLFARGEHLKRHIRSIHTYEKPHRCPYPGCGKDFSRHDNLGQHMRVHKDYVPSKDGDRT